MLEEPYDAWEKLAEAGRDAAAIEAYIRTFDHVTFAELANRFQHYIGTKGSLALFTPADPNIILWAGMSERFSAAVIALLQEQRIVPKPTTPLVYLMDGGMLKCPIVKRIGKTPRKKEGWLPVVLRINHEKESA